MKYIKNYNRFILELINYSNSEFTSLKDLNIQEVQNDSFSCSDNKLTSLEGSPKEVYGVFDCSGNKLTSLEYSPIFVEYSFYCYDNELTSLEGAPNNIGGIFDCEDNKLTSLEGGPEYVDGSFKCSLNNLKSLIGAPKKVNGIFKCSNNNLTNLDYLPNSRLIGLVCHTNDWEKPIPYDIMVKYKLHPKCLDDVDFNWVYNLQQFNKFSSFEYQKEFLEREPENYLDLKPIGYAHGIEKLFPHLFDMDELGLID